MRKLFEDYGLIGLLLLLALGLGKGWDVFSKAFSGFTGVGGYLRARKQEYVKELTRERDELKRLNILLQDDLERAIRAKDLRDDVNARDREVIRALCRLCDDNNVDYSAIKPRLSLEQ